MFDAKSESFRSMKTGNLAQLELDGVANGVDAGAETESIDRGAIANASEANRVERMDVPMQERTRVVKRSGNSGSIAATVETLLTFAEAARVLGISLRQFRRLVDGGRVAFVKVSERTPRIRPSELQRFLDASAVKYSEVQS